MYTLLCIITIHGNLICSTQLSLNLIINLHAKLLLGCDQINYLINVTIYITGCYTDKLWYII